MDSMRNVGFDMFSEIGKGLQQVRGCQIDRAVYSKQTSHGGAAILNFSMLPTSIQGRSALIEWTLVKSM